MYSTDAHNHGYDECILHRGPDRVTECAHSNVSILKDGFLLQHLVMNIFYLVLLVNTC